MAGLVASRRRLLARHGRPVTLRRQTAVRPVAFQDVEVSGGFAVYQPGELTGGLQQGDARLAIGPDEIAAAAWPGPPRQGDKVVIDGLTWAVQGSTPCYDGGELVGFNLWIRGGA